MQKSPEVDPVVPEGGNTKTPSDTGKKRKRQVSPAKAWVFTYNNYPVVPGDPGDPVLAKFKEFAEKYYFGAEIGESGTPHLQGTVVFKKKLRPSSLGLPKEIHWEKRKGSWEEAVTYCQKEDGQKWFAGFKPKRPLKPLACETSMYPWQKSLLKMVNKEPDERTIIWIWEINGNVGKTTFLKYLMRFQEAIPLEGKKNDILFVAAENDSELYVYDVERSLEGFVSYSSIEKVKNGCYMSGKYEGKVIDRNCPHLVVFANFAPERAKLSLDRWRIYKISNLELVEDDGIPEFGV